jgi:hypothetical protein
MVVPWLCQPRRRSHPRARILANAATEELLIMSPPEPIPPSPPTPQDLKAALKAFKRRLKLTRLDEESKLGGGPMSGGRDSGIVAIMPPNQFALAVWEELVRQGKLKKAGGGTYELAEQ